MLFQAAAGAAECRLDFDAHVPQRVELYTSEGCSSCPSADRWLSSLPPHSKRFLLAFHVDYWDDLGWRDRYADARFSERQRDTAARWPVARVYTPAVVIDGGEARGWHRALPAPGNVESSALSLTLREDDRALQLGLDVPDGLQAYAAITESGLLTEVRAGENRGNTLRHDHVVRAYAGPADRSAILDLALPRDLVRGNSRLLVWLEDSEGRTRQGLQRALDVCSATGSLLRR
jgi:hypothetical protein